MKKLWQKLTLGGVASTLLGSVLFLVGCGANGFDFNFLSNVQIQQMEYVEGADTNITNLSLAFETTDITVNFDENAQGVSVSYPQRQNKKGENLSEITVTETENSLSITEKVLPSISLLDLTDKKITVTLPASKTFALDVDGDTGDVTVNEGGNFSCLSVKISTGDVYLSNVQASELFIKASTGNVTVSDATINNDLSVQVSTGNIKLSQATANTLKAKASSGDIQICYASVTQSMSVETSTGDQTLTDINANSAIINTETGKVTAGDLTAVDSLSITTDTGNISFFNNITTNTLKIVADTGDLKAKDCLIDAQNITINTDTGHVAAKLTGTKHDYATTITTSTGDTNISSNLENVLDGLISPVRTLKVKTSTGNIKIYFTNAN